MTRRLLSTVAALQRLVHDRLLFNRNGGGTLDKARRVANVMGLDMTSLARQTEP